MRNKQSMMICFGIAFVFLITAVGTAAAYITETQSFSVLSNFGDKDVFNFTVNSVGTISAEATWTGDASNLALILNGPGQVGYYAREDSTSPLSLSYNVTSADLSKGTDWTISIVNFRGGSAVGTVRITYPTTPPDISITFPPTNGQTFNTDTITVSGIASGDIGLSKVEVRTDSGSWQLASGTTSWSKSITLNEGPNVIYARATDTSGNTYETSVKINFRPDTTSPTINYTEIIKTIIGALATIVAAYFGYLAIKKK